MISASKNFKNKLKDGANIVNYADVTLSDGTVLHLEPKDFMIGGCEIEGKTTDGKFGVGHVIGKTAALKIANYDDRFSQYDFYNAIIHLYVACLLNDRNIEKIKKGKYYSTVPETLGNIININIVDDMFRFDRDYSESETKYPTTLQIILTDACMDCGIPIGFTQFDNMNYVVQEKPEKATYRQVVSWVCQIAGYNAWIDNDGYLKLVWYNTSLLDAYNYKGGDFHNYPHDTIINGGDFTNYSTNTIISGGNFADEMPEHIFRIKSLNIHTDDVQITGVKVIGDEETIALFGEEGYLIEVSENPFVNGKEQEVANYLGARIVGMVFRPFRAEVLNNPLYEPFDIVRVSDIKGNVYLSLLNSVSYKIGGYTTIACEAEDPIRNGSTYTSSAAQAIVEARRNTEKQLTTYDKAVQNMNELSANTMGLFNAAEKQSDGSFIYYQSTKPITVDANGKCHFETGSTVYKKSGPGFFVSTDGGKTYTLGLDSQGNVVLNVIAAIGINADWVNVKDLVAFNATIAGWRIQSNQIVKSIDLYNDMTESGLKNLADDAPVQYWVWLRAPTNETTPVFFVGYKKKSDYLNNSDSVYQIFSARTNGAVTANSFISSNANITGGQISLKTDNKEYSVINIKYLNYELNLSASEVSVVSASNYAALDSNGSLILSSNHNPHTIINEENLVYSGERAVFKNNLYVDGVIHEGSYTSDFGKVLQSSYEMSSPMFGDIGEGIIDEKGLCYIFFDSVFFEIVSTDRSYQVFLQKNGAGDLWVEEKNPEYFLIKGTPGLLFSWEVKVKRRDYEYERLDILDESKKSPEIDYEMLAINYLNNYEEEIYNYEETN